MITVCFLLFLFYVSCVFWRIIESQCCIVLQCIVVQWCSVGVVVLAVVLVVVLVVVLIVVLVIVLVLLCCCSCSVGVFIVVIYLLNYRCNTHHACCAFQQHEDRQIPTQF